MNKGDLKTLQTEMVTISVRPFGVIDTTPAEQRDSQENIQMAGNIFRHIHELTKANVFADDRLHPESLIDRLFQHNGFGFADTYLNGYPTFDKLIANNTFLPKILSEKIRLEELPDLYEYSKFPYGQLSRRIIDFQHSNIPARYEDRNVQSLISEVYGYIRMYSNAFGNNGNANQLGMMAERVLKLESEKKLTHLEKYLSDIMLITILKSGYDQIQSVSLEKSKEFSPSINLKNGINRLFQVVSKADLTNFTIPR